MARSSSSEIVAVVRSLWDATRDRDVARALALMDEDIQWVPLLSDEPMVSGKQALEEHFERLVREGAVADAFALAFEPVDDQHVLVSGALRVRRPDNWLTTVQRWWIYEVRDQLVTRAQSCETREEALQAGRPQQG